MKVVATSDLHGTLPEIPACDLLIVAGDVCPLWNHDLSYQLDWLNGEFRTWLRSVPASAIVGIAGNHDFVFESWGPAIAALFLPWTYLQDAGTEIDGLSIWGLPWVPNLRAWAFFATDEDLAEHYDWVPSGTDIVVSHGPPRGYSDRVSVSHVGAEAANTMLERVKPKLFVCGHIHEGYGAFRHPSGAEIYNVAHNDRLYLPDNPPVEIDL